MKLWPFDKQRPTSASETRALEPETNNISLITSRTDYKQKASQTSLASEICSTLAIIQVRHTHIKYYLIFLLTVLYSCNFSMNECKDIQEWKIDKYRFVKS